MRSVSSNQMMRMGFRVLFVIEFGILFLTSHTCGWLMIRSRGSYLWWEVDQACGLMIRRISKLFYLMVKLDNRVRRLPSLLFPLLR